MPLKTVRVIIISNVHNWFWRVTLNTLEGTVLPDIEVILGSTKFNEYFLKDRFLLKKKLFSSVVPGMFIYFFLCSYNGKLTSYTSLTWKPMVYLSSNPICLKGFQKPPVLSWKGFWKPLGATCTGSRQLLQKEQNNPRKFVTPEAFVNPFVELIAALGNLYMITLAAFCKICRD